MKILPSVTHPQVVPNLHELLLLNIKEDILSKIFLEVNGVHQLVYQHSSKYLLLKLKKMKFMQVWKNMRVSKLRQNVHFWVHYLFKPQATCQNNLTLYVFVCVQFRYINLLYTKGFD